MKNIRVEYLVKMIEVLLPIYLNGATMAPIIRNFLIQKEKGIYACKLWN